MVGCDYDYDFKSFLCIVGFKGNVNFIVFGGQVVVMDGKLTNVVEGILFLKLEKLRSYIYIGRSSIFLLFFYII